MGGVRVWRLPGDGCHPPGPATRRPAGTRSSWPRRVGPVAGGGVPGHRVNPAQARGVRAGLAGGRPRHQCRAAGRRPGVSRGGRLQGRERVAVMGRPGQALDLNMSLADRLQPECQTEELRALYGHVVLQAAMAAAALGDQGKASELIGEATDVARFVTPGSNHYRLAFEPVNVTLHEVGALVILGENDRAVEVADAITVAGLRMLRQERRAALLVDTARACSQAGNRDEALRRLLAAEEIAAPEVRCRPVAQAAIADLLHRARGAPPLALARLAERAGVAP